MHAQTHVLRPPRTSGADRRRHEGLQRESPEGFVGRDHAGQLAGNPHRTSAVEARVVPTRSRGELRVEVRPDPHRTGLPIVQGSGFTGLFDEDDHESTATDSAGVRTGHGEREGGGDRGVDGVSARLEDLDPGFAGWLRVRGDGAIGVAGSKIAVE